MGIIEKPHLVKLITGILVSSDEAFHKAEKALCRKFGRIDYKSKGIDFDFTDYYKEDMGSGLKRYFLSFEGLIDPVRLPSIKRITNRIEEQISKHAKARKRPVNIDPGYLTDAKLILASTKDYNHRIYLDRCIYAEITLCYQDGDFKSQSWTYPDYKTDEYKRIFRQIRELFMKQRKPSRR